MKYYLAGPVGYGFPGIEWKKKLKSLLRDLGHEVYDPIDNDHKYPEVPRLNLLKKDPKRSAHEIKKIMQPIFTDDVQFIKEADYIICYFAGRALGTSSEQGIAYFLSTFMKRSIKTISIFDKDFSPDEWVLCCSDHIFFSTEDCLTFLRKEANNETLCYPAVSQV